MVSRAGRELLKNTIRTVDHHNRVLEEQIMWKLHGNKQAGSSSSVDEQTIHKRRRKTKVEKSERPSLQPKTADTKTAKWDHNGFLELYPEAAKTSEKSQPKKKKMKVSKIKEKRKKKKKTKKLHNHSSDTSEEEIWVEKT